MKKSKTRIELQKYSNNAQIKFKEISFMTQNQIRIVSLLFILWMGKSREEGHVFSKYLRRLDTILLPCLGAKEGYMILEGGMAY